MKPSSPRGPSAAAMVLRTCLLLAACLAAACQRPPLAPPVALFDLGHGEGPIAGGPESPGYSLLAGLFRAEGFQVEGTDRPLDHAVLKNRAAVLLCGPTRPFLPAEIQALARYVNDGGQLVLLLADRSPSPALVASLGAAVSHAQVQPESAAAPESESGPLVVSSLPPHPLTRSVARLVFTRAWALDTPLAANIIAASDPLAWIDLNRNGILDSGDARQSFALLVTSQIGHGHSVLSGDETIFENRGMTDGNQRMAANLAGWLKAGASYSN